MSIKRKYDKASLKGLRLLGKGLLKNHVTPTGLDSDFDFSFYNHCTPSGLALISDFAFYNPNTLMRLISDIYNHFYRIFNTFGLLKSRRDDMIIEQLFNKQLNPVGVTY
jgi:hypothetical protein